VRGGACARGRTCGGARAGTRVRACVFVRACVWVCVCMNARAHASRAHAPRTHARALGRAGHGAARACAHAPRRGLHCCISVEFAPAPLGFKSDAASTRTRTHMRACASLAHARTRV
jgi:hypothetical protein